MKQLRSLTLITIAVATALWAVLLPLPRAHAVSYNASTFAAPSSVKNIATNTTTTVKTGYGVLDGITINTAGGSGSTITVYDNTTNSGTKIATMDGTSAVGTRVLYNGVFKTGLTVVTGGGTPAPDITVAYH